MSYNDREKIEEVLPCVGFTAIVLLTLACGSYDGWDFSTMLKAIALGSMMNPHNKNIATDLGKETAELRLGGK